MSWTRRGTFGSCGNADRTPARSQSGQPNPGLICDKQPQPIAYSNYLRRAPSGGPATTGAVVGATANSGGRGEVLAELWVDTSGQLRDVLESCGHVSAHERLVVGHTVAELMQAPAGRSISRRSLPRGNARYRQDTHSVFSCAAELR